MKKNYFLLMLMGLTMSTLVAAQNSSKIEFTNQEIELTVNDSVHLEVKFITDSSETVIDSLSYAILPDSLGNVENGVFHALKSGKGILKAFYQTFSDSIRIKIEALPDSTSGGTDTIPVDTAGMHKIYISRVMPSGKVLPAHTIYEGQTYTLGGMQRPMNILNGGEITFPKGSLKEDIKLLIELPKFAEIGAGDTITFKNKKVMNGVSFHVYRNDSLISPYYFEMPLEVSLPYKKGLINKLGLDPNRLSLFYANDSIELDAFGISNVFMDTATNMIKSKVAHFSNLVVAEGNNVTLINNSLKSSVLVYPNPVADRLIIHMNNQKNETYQVTVYNLSGKAMIRTTLNSSTSDINVKGMAPGLYLLRVTDNSNNEMAKTTIIKQ